MNFRRKLAIGVLALAGYVGTFYNSGGLPPFYTVKTGEGGGLCVSAVTKLEEGSKFYGPVVSVVTFNRGEVYGAIISGGTRNGGKVNGALVNIASASSWGGGKVNGAEISLVVNSANVVDNIPSTVNGFQASIFYNSATLESKCVQIGLVNDITNKKGEKPIRTIGISTNYSL